jgi:hypothetical protein
MTLYLDGIYLLPPFAALMFIWHREAAAERGRHLSFWGDGTGPARSPIWSRFSRVALGAAIFSAVVVNYVGALLGVGEHVARGNSAAIPANTTAHVASYFIGLPLALALLWFTVLKPGGLVNRLLDALVPGPPGTGCCRKNRRQSGLRNEPCTARRHQGRAVRSSR